MSEYIINSRFARAIEKQYNVSVVSAVNFNYIRSIEYKNLPFGPRELSDLERIKVIFPNLEELKFINIKFDFDEFPRLYINNLYFYNCNISGISFENVDVLNSFTCKLCKIQSLDKFANFKNLKKLVLEEEKILVINEEKLMINVMPNYPRFDFYSKEKQYEILVREDCLVDGFIKLRINNNLSFNNLETLNLVNYDFVSSELDNFSKCKNLEEFIIRTNKILDIKFLGNFKNLKKLSIDLIKRQELKDISIINNLKNITELELSSVLNVTDVLKNDNKNIEVLKIGNTEIVESDYISKLSKLKLLHLRDDDIKQNIFDLIVNYTKDNDIRLIVESEELKNKYRNNILEFKDKHLKNQLKELLNIESDDINEYDLLVANVNLNEFEVTSSSFRDIIDLKIYDKMYVKKLVIAFDTKDNVSDVIDYFDLLKCNICIKIVNLNSITMEDITKIRNTHNVVKYRIVGDSVEYTSDMLFFVKTYFKNISLIDRNLNVNLLKKDEKFKYFVNGYNYIVNNFVIVDNIQDLDEFQNTVLEEDKQSIYYDVLDEKSSILSICNFFNRYCMYFGYESQIMTALYSRNAKYYFIKIKFNNKWYNIDIINDVLNNSMNGFLVNDKYFEDLYYDTSCNADEVYDKDFINNLIMKG